MSCFSDEERRPSKTAEALRNLNLPKFLPEVPAPNLYVRPEFDFSGNRIVFNDEKPNEAKVVPEPVARSDPESASETIPESEEDVSGSPAKIFVDSVPRFFPEPDESVRSGGSVFPEPDHILKITEKLRSEDSEHFNFISPGSVNAGELVLS